MVAKLQSLKPAVRIADLRQVSTLTESQGGGYGKGRGGRPWSRIRQRILRRDSYTCQADGCHRVSDQLEIDHIVPLSQGGTDDDSNLRALCIPCHKVKTARESAGRA